MLRKWAHTDCTHWKLFIVKQFVQNSLYILLLRIFKIFVCLLRCKKHIFNRLYSDSGQPCNAGDFCSLLMMSFIFLSFTKLRELRELSAALRGDRWKCFRIIGCWIYCFWIKDHFLASERTTKWLQRDESQSCLNFYITIKDASESLLL